VFRKLDEGGAAESGLQLPGTKRSLDIKGEVAGRLRKGRAGIRFQVLSGRSKKGPRHLAGKRALTLGGGAMFINATTV